MDHIEYDAGNDIEEIRELWLDTAEDTSDEAWLDYWDERADHGPGVAVTRSGFEFSELVNELEWAESETAYAAIEAQLPVGYGDSADNFTVYLSDDHAATARAAWEQTLEAEGGDPESAAEVEANESAANYGG